MKLTILRHAATEPNSITGNDFDRKLKNEGRHQCHKLRKYFELLCFQSVWCSSALRTKETAQLILTDKHPEPLFFDEMYLATNEDLLQKIWNDCPNGDLLLIGHNPGISRLAAYSIEEPFILDTGELIHIEFEVDTWFELTRGTGTIVDRYRP